MKWVMHKAFNVKCKNFKLFKKFYNDIINPKTSMYTTRTRVELITVIIHIS